MIILLFVSIRIRSSTALLLGSLKGDKGETESESVLIHCAFAPEGSALREGVERREEISET